MMPTKTYSSLKDLSSRQRAFLTSLFNNNLNFYIEVKWLMAKQPQEVKEEVAKHFSKLFTVEDGKLVWSAGFRLFYNNPQARAVAQGNFAKLNDEEKNENYYSFIQNYIQNSLTINFNDEQACQGITRLMDLYRHLKSKDRLLNPQKYPLFQFKHSYSMAIKELLYYVEDVVQGPIKFDIGIHNKKNNIIFRYLASTSISSIRTATKFAVPSLLALAVLMGIVLTVLYGFATGNLVLAGLTGFSFPVVAAIKSKIDAKMGPSIKAEFDEHSKQIEKISIEFKKFIRWQAEKYIDASGIKHEYQAIVHHQPVATPVVSTPEAYTPRVESKPAVVTDVPAYQPAPIVRVRPKSNYKAPEVIAQPVMSGNARMVQALNNVYPRHFNEADVKVIPKGMRAILDTDALSAQGLNDHQINAIRETLTNSEGRHFLPEKDKGNNGIKTAKNKKFSCPITQSTLVTHSIIKNIFSKHRIHGSVYKTNEGDVVMYNRAAKK